MGGKKRTKFRPIEPVDRYLPIADHGLIGDGKTAALVGRDGAVSWFCLPSFDSEPVFCRLLDAKRGGAFTVAPEGLRESRQYYQPDTAVLATEMRSDTGTVRLTDALLLCTGADLTEDVPAGRQELQRTLRVLHGRVRLRISITCRGGATTESRGGGHCLRLPTRPDLELQLWSTVPLTGLQTVLELREGQELVLTLAWGKKHFFHHAREPAKLLEETAAAWQRWLGNVRYEGPEEALVHRSAITLKLLDHFEDGAMVAAPTSSLPEEIGGVRNWDYRFTWVRDAALAVYALRRIGLTHEADGFLGWVLDAIEAHGRQPRVLYAIDGSLPPPEREDPELEGYRASRPVRWGNAAAEQVQHDAYGELLDCAFQWSRDHEGMEDRLWARLCDLAELARTRWRTPDHGIWEVRSPGKIFTYSAALCHVALDRAARMAEDHGLSGDVSAWVSEAKKIQEAILEETWNPAQNALTDSLGGRDLDAGVLALPLRRVVPSRHPRMLATTEAIRERLGAGKGLLYRYAPGKSLDGLPGGEGAFLICSFWLVENLALQGRAEEALDLYGSLCGFANPLGLLPEEIEPGTGAFLGNFPQALSHIGLIAAGVRLARSLSSATDRRQDPTQ
jgi:alpha,alpha-trehalase